MDKKVRIGAAALALGVSLAGPGAVGVAWADGGDADAASVSAGTADEGVSSAAPAPAVSDRSRAAGRSSGSVVSARSGRVVGGEGRRGAAGTAAASRSASARASVTPRARSVGIVVTGVDTTPRIVAVQAGSAAVAAATEAAVVSAAPQPAVVTPGRVRGIAAAPQAVAVGSSINSLVNGVFDALANWLSSLPPNPITDVVEGALLLVRRSLFNQAPTAVPVQWGQTSTNIVGSIGASDLEGDPIVYTVVSQPKYGNVVIDPTGAYTYTPGGFDSYGGTDEFTVRLTETGWHLNLVGPSSTDVTVPVAIAGVEGLQGFTKGFDIYNWTSKTLKYLRYENQAPDSAPNFNAEFKPGEAAHFEVTFRFFKDTTSRAVFEAVGSTDPQPALWAVNMLVESYTKASETNGCFASGTNACTAYPAWTEQTEFGPYKHPGKDMAIFMDPPNTVKDFSGQESQAQADLLNALCSGSGAGSGATCGSFKVKETINVTPAEADATQLGSSAKNLSDAQNSQQFSYSFTQTTSFSARVNAFIGAKIGQAVKAGLGAEVSETWTEAKTFTETTNQTVLPWSYNVVFVAPYLSNVKGNFTVKLGNTTWNFRDVVFTLPTKSMCPGDVCTGLKVFRGGPLQGGFRIKDATSSTPFNPSYLVGDKGQLKVTAYNGYNEQWVRDLTPDATYVSSNPSVATVDKGTGKVDALAPGTTTITATYAWTIGAISQTLTESLEVTVKNPQA
jgi:hypothetical protein